MSRPTRPVLRYHGGKWRLAPWIIDHFPAHRCYTEVYGGAASVLLRKQRSYAEIYNDLDGEIVSLFRVLRDRQQAEELERLLRLTPFARTEFEISYDPVDDPIEQARRTVVRALLGFGSAAASGAKTGFRSNSNRSNTTPAHDWASYPDGLRWYVERLRGVAIENRPAVEVLAQHDSPDTLHYVDPPYVISTRKMRNPYCKKGYRFELTDDNHRDLRDVLVSLEGAVVISGYPCELYDGELYPDWKRTQRAATADRRSPRTEVLWLNAKASEGLSQGVLGLEAS